MFKLFFLSLTAFLFIGCVGLTKPDFQISTSQSDKFADKTKPKIYSSYNRLSTKSVCGGIHIDDKGVYIDPVASFDKNQKLEQLSLVVLYYNLTSTDTLSNDVCGKKGFEPIQEVVFLADEKRISIKVKPFNLDIKYYNWNNISNGYDGIYREDSAGIITLDDLKAIANAKNLDVKVVGGKNSQTFENSELEDDFRINLKSFIKAITR
ncbi:MAG: hypothetical protein AB7D29_07565 [Campylobacterales bacterium]